MVKSLGFSKVMGSFWKWIMCDDICVKLYKLDKL